VNLACVVQLGELSLHGTARWT